MADIRDIVSKVKKSKLGQVVSNITSSLDRDKQQAGFQFTAPNSFARQGVQRVQQSFKEDPGRYSLQRLFAEQPKNTVSLFKPVLGQQRAEDLAYGLRGASQLTPFGYGLDQKTREISRLNAPQTERQGQAQSVGRSLYGYALTAPIGGTNYLANTVGRAAVSTGFGAGIGAGISKLTGGDFKEGARQGAFQGFKQGPLLAVTNPLTSKAVGAVAPGLGIVGSQVAKRSIGGVANVIEDEILSKVDGLPVDGRDRIQSLVLGAVMTGNDEAFKTLKTNLLGSGIQSKQAQNIVEQTKSRARDIRGRFAKIGQVAGQTKEFTPISGGGFLQDLKSRVPASQDLIEGGQGLVRKAKSRLSEAYQAGNMKRVTATVDGQKIDELLPVDQANQLIKQLQDRGVKYTETDIKNQGGFIRLGNQDSQLLLNEARKYDNPQDFYNRIPKELKDIARENDIRGLEQHTKIWEEANLGKEKILNTINPTGNVVAEYDAKTRAELPLGPNITTLDKTMGIDPEETITIYRGVSKKHKKINPGDFVTTNPELAKAYTGDGNVLSMKVKAKDVLDDITEPLGEEYLYRPSQTKKEPTIKLFGRELPAGESGFIRLGFGEQKPQLDTELNKVTPEKIQNSRQKIEAKQIQKQKGLTFQGEQPVSGGSKLRVVKGGKAVEGPSKASSKISISRDKKYSFNINKKKLGLNAEQSKRLDNVVETMRPVLEANKGKTLTKQEIIEGGRKAKVLEDVVGREEAKAFAESLQATRNFLRTESQQVGVTPKFLEQLEIVSSVAADAGRRLQAFNIGAEDITIKEKVLRDIIKIGADAKEVLEAGKNVDWNDAEQITKFYRKFKPATLSEKLDEFRYTNMLSSPNTQINNAFSNFLQTAILAPIEKTVRGGVSFAEAKLTGKEQEYFARQGVDYAKGYWKSLPEAIQNFSKTFSGNAGLTKPDVDFLPTSTSRLQKLYTTPLRALEASDQFFRTLVKGGEIESLKTEGITGAKASKIAEQQADYRTFRQAFDPEGKLGQNKVLQIWDKWNVAIQQLRNVPGGKYLVPFLQTPTNILKQGFEYSPLGFSTVKGSSNPSEQLTKAIIGSGVFTSAYALANSGMTTWDTPTNANERAEFYAAGLQPYSVKVGDKWVSYSKLGPLAYPIAMASALKWAKDNGGDEDQLASIGTAMAGTLGFFADQSYVRGIGDIIDAFRGDEYKQARGLSNIPAQLIPYRSFMGWIARQVDPVYRKTSGGSVLDQVGKSLVSQVPFASKSLEAYQTPFGTDSQRQFPTVNAFSPFSITKERPQEKEYYDARSQLRSQNKQADKLIKQIESGKNVKLDTSKMITKQVVDLTKKKIEAGIDVTDSELETAYLGKTLSMPSSNRYDKSLKDTQLWSALSTIDNNEALSDAQKQVLNTRIAKELGVTTDDLKLYSVAKDNNDNKTLYLLDQRDAQSNDDFLRTLINGRKPVNGKILTSDGVIDNLVNDGIIPKALGDDLKKIDLDDKGKLKVKKTSSGRKTKRATFNYSALKSLKPFGGSARVSVPKINARSLTFGG